MYRPAAGRKPWTSAPRLREQSSCPFLCRKSYLYTSRYSPFTLVLSFTFFPFEHCCFLTKALLLAFIPHIYPVSSPSVKYNFLPHPWPSSRNIQQQFLISTDRAISLGTLVQREILDIETHKTSCQGRPRYQVATCRLRAVTTITITRRIAQPLLHHVLENTLRMKKLKSFENASTPNSKAKFTLIMEDRQ
jgi:hypothetical protein